MSGGDIETIIHESGTVGRISTCATIDATDGVSFTIYATEVIGFSIRAPKIIVRVTGMVDTTVQVAAISNSELAFKQSRETTIRDN